MGQWMSRAWNALIREKEVRVLMVGLDAAGKTTILYKLKLGDVIQTVPTIGFNVESVQYKNIKFNVWDVGGQFKIRALWRYYFTGSQAVIFVVDTADRDRIAEAKEELWRLLEEDELRDASVLVLANKNDLPHSMSVSDLFDKLGLREVRNRQVYVQATNAIAGDGLYEGLDWLAHSISKRKR
eukprot:ANDGO_05881.mRNA.1 ADP-ribosylation factor 1